MLPKSPKIYPGRKELAYAAHCGLCNRKHAIVVNYGTIGTVRRCGYCLAKLRKIVESTMSIFRNSDDAAPDTTECFFLPNRVNTESI